MSYKRFKIIREYLGLTQEEVSLMFGLADRSVVNRYESGARSPSKLTMAIMEILNELPKKDSQKLMDLLKNHVASQKGAK